MSDSQARDPLGAENDRRKLEGEITDEGPPVAQMASTYGSSLVTSEEHAAQLIADDGGKGDAPRDGTGRSRHAGPTD